MGQIDIAGPKIFSEIPLLLISINLSFLTPTDPKGTRAINKYMPYLISREVINFISNLESEMAHLIILKYLFILGNFEI